MQDADNDPDELEWVIHKKINGKKGSTLHLHLHGGLDEPLK
jgi:hypothetical protein